MRIPGKFGWDIAAGDGEHLRETETLFGAITLAGMMAVSVCGRF
jgi:hypothetical protein